MSILKQLNKQSPNKEPSSVTIQDGFLQKQLSSPKVQTKQLQITTTPVYMQQKPQQQQNQSQNNYLKQSSTMNIQSLEYIIDDMQKIIQEGKYIKAFMSIRKKLADKEIPLDAYVRLIRRFLHALQKLMMKYLNYKLKRAKFKIEPLIAMYYESLNKFDMLLQILSGEQKSVEEASIVLGYANASFIFQSCSMNVIENFYKIQAKKSQGTLINTTQQKIQLDQQKQNANQIQVSNVNQSNYSLSPNNSPKIEYLNSSASNSDIENVDLIAEEFQLQNTKEEIRSRNETVQSMKSQATKAKIATLNMAQQKQSTKKLIQHLPFYEEQLILFQLKGLYISYKYYRKLEQPQNALAFLRSALELMDQLEKSCFLSREMMRQAALLHNCAGLVHMEQENSKDAIVQFEKSFEYSQKNINSWLKMFAQTEQQKISVKMELKLELVVQECVVILTNWSMACEQQKDIQKMLECLKMAQWMSQRQLLYEESMEIQNVTAENIRKMNMKYQDQIDEMRDINRIIRIIWSELIAENEDNEAERMDQQGLDFFNSMFYDKFKCGEMNQTQCIYYVKDQGNINSNNVSMDAAVQMTRSDSESKQSRLNTFLSQKNPKNQRLYSSLVGNVLPKQQVQSESKIQLNQNVEEENENKHIQNNKHQQQLQLQHASISQQVSPRSTNFTITSAKNTVTSGRSTVANIINNNNNQIGENAVLAKLGQNKDGKNINHNSSIQSGFQSGNGSTTLNSQPVINSLINNNNNSMGDSMINTKNGSRIIIIENNANNNTQPNQPSASKSISFNNSMMILNGDLAKSVNNQKTNQSKDSDQFNKQHKQKNLDFSNHKQPSVSVFTHGHSKSEYYQYGKKGPENNNNEEDEEYNKKKSAIKSQYAWASKIMLEGDKRSSLYQPKCLTTNKYFMSQEQIKSQEEAIAKAREKEKQEKAAELREQQLLAQKLGQLDKYNQNQQQQLLMQSRSAQQLCRNKSQENFEQMLEEEGLSYFKNQFKHLNLGDEKEQTQLRQGVMDLDYALRQYIMEQLMIEESKNNNNNQNNNNNDNNDINNSISNNNNNNNLTTGTLKDQPNYVQQQEKLMRQKYMEKYLEFLKQMKMEQFDHREFGFSKLVVSFKKAFSSRGLNSKQQNAQQISKLLAANQENYDGAELNKFHERKMLDIELAVTNAQTQMPILKQQADRKNQRLVHMLNNDSNNNNGKKGSINNNNEYFSSKQLQQQGSLLNTCGSTTSLKKSTSQKKVSYGQALVNEPHQMGSVMGNTPMLISQMEYQPQSAKQSSLSAQQQQLKGNSQSQQDLKHNILKHYKSLHMKNIYQQHKYDNNNPSSINMDKPQEQMTEDEIKFHLQKIQQVTQETIRQAIRNNEQEHDNLQVQIQGFRSAVVSQHRPNTSKFGFSDNSQKMDSVDNSNNKQSSNNKQTKDEELSGKKNGKIKLNSLSPDNKNNKEEEKKGDCLHNFFKMYPNLAISTKSFIVRNKASKGNVTVPEMLQLMKKTQGESTSPYLNKQKKLTIRKQSKRFSIVPIGTGANQQQN